MSPKVIVWQLGCW